MPVHTGESPMAMGVICLSTWFFVALVTDSSEEEVYFLVKKKNVQTYNLHALKSSNQKTIKTDSKRLPLFKRPQLFKKGHSFRISLYERAHVIVKKTFHIPVRKFRQKTPSKNANNKGIKGPKLTIVHQTGSNQDFEIQKFGVKYQVLFFQTEQTVNRKYQDSVPPRKY